MIQIGTYTQVKIAFIVIGIAIMSAAGGATLAHTRDMTTTTIALLATAVGLALFGRRALRWWWGEVMLGLETPYGEPSAEYEDTTRAHKLAPKLLRMVEKANEPMTVIVTGVEPPAKDGTPDPWGEALRTAARAGATLCHYLPPGTSGEEAAIAQTLADEYPRCRCVRITDTGSGALDAIHPTMAWEGHLKPSNRSRASSPRRRTSSCASTGKPSTPRGSRAATSSRCAGSPKPRTATSCLPASGRRSR